MSYYDIDAILTDAEVPSISLSHHITTHRQITN